jgi:hypothetical protein
LYSTFVIQFNDLIYCFIFCELECRIHGNKNVTRKTPVCKIHSSIGYSFPKINSELNKFTLRHCCLFLGSSYIVEQNLSRSTAFRVEYISYMYEYMPKHTDIHIYIDFNLVRSNCKWLSYSLLKFHMPSFRMRPFLFYHWR